MIEKNVRVPVKVIGDIRAQVAACHTAEKGFLSLLARYGAATLQRYFDELLDDAERRMRAEIAAVPDGVYEFTDYIDGLGEHPEPLVFHVAVTVRGDELHVDWAGSSPQVKAGINSPIPFTRSSSYVAIRCAIAPYLPNSEGYMRPIQVSAPLGTIMNPRLPGPCAARGITGYRMIDTLLGALAQAIPDRVPAAGEGGSSLPSIGGYQEGKPFVHVETILGTWGGRPTKDGDEGVPNPGANQSNQPIELIEAELPLEAVQYALVPDSGGPGKYRGGLGLVREYRLLADEAGWTMRSDRRSHPPYGVQGGKPGAPSSNVLNPGLNERVVPVLPMESILLKRGDVIRMTLAGGGGYGDPLERDPSRVLEDFLDEKITAEHARDAYGVVIDPVALTVDVAATERWREELARCQDRRKSAISAELDQPADPRGLTSGR
jgi:N-methylhydantoinase B